MTNPTPSLADLTPGEQNMDLALQLQGTSLALVLSQRPGPDAAPWTERTLEAALQGHGLACSRWTARQLLNRYG